MRMRLILSATMLAAAAGAQDPATQVPGTNAVVVPKAKGGPTKAEFRIGGFNVMAERSFDNADSVNTATGQVKGVEVLMRAKAIGIYVRSLSGQFGSGATA